MSKLMKLFAAIMLIVSFAGLRAWERRSILSRRLLQRLRAVGWMGMGPVGSWSWLGPGQSVFLWLAVRLGACSSLAQWPPGNSPRLALLVIG